MYNWERILAFLQGRATDSFCDDCLSSKAGVQNRVQVNQITNRLKAEGKIWRGYGLCSGCGDSSKLVNRAPGAGAAPAQKPSAVDATKSVAGSHQTAGAPRMHPSGFEQLARQRFGELFAAHFHVGSVRGVPKKFDLMDEEKGFVGDAKYFTMVGGSRLPPAKFSVIAEHVWLLEKTGARRKFLVFGNDRRVPDEWLRRYGHLAANVEFYFMTDAGEIRRLT